MRVEVEHVTPEWMATAQYARDNELPFPINHGALQIIIDVIEARTDHSYIDVTVLGGKKEYLVQNEVTTVIYGHQEP